MKRLLALLLTLSLFSCNKDINSYSITGTAQGFEDGTKVILYTLDENQPKAIDTLIVKDGKFSGTYPKTEDVALNYMRIGDMNASIIYFPENEDLKATIYKDSIAASSFTGSKQNEVYNEFVTKIKGFNTEKEQEMMRFKIAQQQQDTATLAEVQRTMPEINARETAYKKQSVKENNNSIFSVMLVSEMLNQKEINTAEATEIINNFTPKLAATSMAKQVKEAIDSMSATDIGGTAPSFSAPTPTGETLSLKDAMGTYTLIDFWASWCKPCRIENPNVVKVYNKYHSKGFNIISVSLDKKGQKDRWIKAITDDNMDWHHVSNLEFWQDPIAGMYSVRSIPATFLLDENGTIIAKNLRGNQLEAKMASLLGDTAN